MAQRVRRRSTAAHLESEDARRSLPSAALEFAASSPRLRQLQAYQDMARGSARTGQLQALQAMADARAPGGVAQRTAWEKTGTGWEHRSDVPHFEKPTDSERTPPPGNIGEVGWIYSTNTMSFYDNYRKYYEAVRPDIAHSMPPSDDKSVLAGERRAKLNADYEAPRDPGSRTIMVTGLEGEDKLLGKKGGGVTFQEDLTHNYLLWSVPKYTGENLVKELGGGELTTVSGEAAAERGVAEGQGYMMKQTKEHLEALTALTMIQRDENIQPGDIVAQYGATRDPSKVDPLHNPRDPQSQTDFVDLLKSFEAFYPDKTGDAGKIALAVEAKSKDGDLAGRIHSALTGAPNLKAFNEWFHGGGFAERLFQAVTKENSPIGPRDEPEEVTRVPLKDKSDPRMQAVGGRQAVFDSIWGPKSAAVVEKAAERSDSVRSHGLAYHWNPKMTVQAQHEFPPYRDLLLKKLAPRLEHTKMFGLFQTDVIGALAAIITAINEINPQGSTRTEDLPTVRKDLLAIVTSNNLKLEVAMSEIRKFLATL